MVLKFTNRARRILDVIFRMYKPWPKAKFTSDKEFGVLYIMFSLAGVWLYLKTCVNIGNSLLGPSGSPDWWCSCPFLEGCSEFSQSWNHVGSVFEQRLKIITSSPHSSTLCHQIADGLVGCLLLGKKRHCSFLTSVEKRLAKFLGLVISMEKDPKRKLNYLWGFA